MEKIILEEKRNQKLAVFSLEMFSISTLWNSGIWILACVTWMHIWSPFQQCEYIHACKFSGMWEKNTQSSAKSKYFIC